MDAAWLRTLYESMRPDGIEPGDPRWVRLDDRAGISPHRAWAPMTRAALLAEPAPTVRFVAATVGVGLSTAMSELAWSVRTELPVRRVSLELRDAPDADTLDRALADALGAARTPAAHALPAADLLRSVVEPLEGGVLLVDRREQDLFAPPTTMPAGLWSWIERRMAQPLPMHLVIALPIEVVPWATPRLPLCVLPALPVIGVDTAQRHASFSAMRALLDQRVPTGAMSEIVSPTETLQLLEAAAGTPGELFDLVRGVLSQHVWQPLGAVERAIRRRQAALARFKTGPAQRVLQRLQAGEPLDTMAPERAPVVAALLRAGAIQAVAERDVVWRAHPLVAEA